MRTKIKLSIVCLLITFGSGIASHLPAPTVIPDGVAFDPNQATYRVIGAFSGYHDNTIIKMLEIVEPDGDAITIDANGINLSAPLEKNLEDGAKQYIYTWTALLEFPGISFIDVKVTDSKGLFDENSCGTIVLECKVNHAPIITGCR